MENSYSVASSESVSHLRYTISQTVVRFLVNFVAKYVAIWLQSDEVVAKFPVDF